VRLRDTVRLRWNLLRVTHWHQNINARLMRGLCRALVVLAERQTGTELTYAEAVTLCRQYAEWAEGRGVEALLENSVRELQLFLTVHWDPRRG